jgi:fibronectin-binding autotransporter adhesin
VWRRHPADTGIRIGTARGTNIRPLYGTVDETAVWANKALSATEVLDAYNRGLAGVSLTNTNAVRGYSTSTSGNAWLTGANWGGTSPGVTGNATSTNGDVAVVGNFAFTGGLGIDMNAAGDNLALGAISFNSLAGSGNLSIGNSATTNGTLTLNGGQIDGFSNVILNNEGLSNLTIANVQGTDSGQRMTLQLGGTTNSIRAAAGRTLTVATDITERTAGSSVSIDGGGSVVLTAANTYTGGTAINAGTLAANAASALGAGVATVASGATLDIGHADAIQAATLTPAIGSTVSFTAAAGTYTIGALAGDSDLVATGKTLAIGGNNASTTYSGNVTADALTKQGTGMLTLSGSNTLTDTRIEAGSVFASSGGALGSGTVTLAGGGLLVAPGTAITNAIVLDGTAASNVLGSAVELDYLVVGGGGGGGGRDSSGGGGAGGVVSNLVSAGLTPIVGQAGDSLALTVGGGGAGGGVSSVGGAAGQGADGSPSSFATVTALGGGGGGAYNTGGKAGSSGGGSGRGPAPVAQARQARALPVATASGALTTTRVPAAAERARWAATAP